MQPTVSKHQRKKWSAERTKYACSILTEHYIT